MQNSKRRGDSQGFKRLAFEPLEDRVVLTATNASLAAYNLSNLPESTNTADTTGALWMNLTDFSFSDVVDISGLDEFESQGFDDVLAGEVYNTDLRMSVDEITTPPPTGTSVGLCASSGCSVAEDPAHGDLLTLTQSSGESDVLRIESNAMHQWYVEVTGVDTGETVDIFGVTMTRSNEFLNNEGEVSGEEFHVTTPGASRITTDSSPASYTSDMTFDKDLGVPLSVEGIRISESLGATCGETSPSCATILTEPATTLLIRYANANTNASDIGIRIGRLELGARVLPGPNDMGNGNDGEIIDASTGTYPLAAQGIALGDQGADRENTVFATSYFDEDFEPSTGIDGPIPGEWRVSTLSIDSQNASEWAVLAEDVHTEIEPDEPTDSGNHYGALDYYDDALWIARYHGTPDTVAKIDVSSFDSDDSNTHMSIPNTPEVLYVINEAFTTGPTDSFSSTFVVDAIDATAVHGHNLYVSGTVRYSDTNEDGFFGIVRYDYTIPPTGHPTPWAIELADGVDGAGNYIPANDERRTLADGMTRVSTTVLRGGTVLEQLPETLGFDFAGGAGARGNRLFAQGLRVVPGNDQETPVTPDRLYAIITDPQPCVIPGSVTSNESSAWCTESNNVKTGSYPQHAFTGMYEFDISPTALGTPGVPSRMWHIPHREQSFGGNTWGRHHEGFDFVPWHPGQIYLSNSSSEVLRIELTDMFADHDLNGDHAVDQKDIDFLGDVIAENISSSRYDFFDDGVLNTDDKIKFALDVVANAVVGDVNMDGHVNSTDLGLLLNNFSNDTERWWGHGDFDGDEDVTSADLGLLLNNFGIDYDFEFLDVVFAIN